MTMSIEVLEGLLERMEVNLARQEANLAYYREHEGRLVMELNRARRLKREAKELLL